MALELKPCPFCGAAPKLEVWGFGELFTIECNGPAGCGATGPHCESQDGAENAWNCRPVVSQNSEKMTSNGC